MARQKATNVTVMTLGGHNYLDSFTSATVTFEHQTEDGRGAVDYFEDPVAVGASGTLEIEAHVNVGDPAPLVAQANSSDPSVALSFNLDGTLFTPNGTITSASLSAPRGGLQAERVTIRFKGGTA